MIKLIHGDCLEKMKDIPDKSIDMILTDLPFGTTSCKWDVVIPFNKYVQIGKKVIYEQEYVFDKMKSGVSYKEALEDFLSISKDGLWDNYNRIIKPNGAIVLTASQPFTSALVMSNPVWFKYEWIWEKTRASNPYLAKRQPLRAHESVLVFGIKPCYYPQKTEGASYTISPRAGGRVASDERSNREGFVGKVGSGRFPRSVVNISNPSAEMGLHPTQKPVALLEYLIKTYTLEGETVLDNTFGSCSTGVACLNTNRNFIGIEKDAHYFQVGKDRVEKHLITLDIN